jgi:hypothetical protein
MLRFTFPTNPAFAALSDGHASIEADSHIVQVIGREILGRSASVRNHLRLCILAALRIDPDEVVSKNTGDHA